MSNRLLPALLLFVALLGGVWLTIRQSQLPPADFTFSNETEIESVDPAVVTGQPEGRIVHSLFEGLVRLSAVDRRAEPGMAERWEVSDDGLTYTFYLRPNLRWSNGEPFTSEDIIYSMRRFLSPSVAAEYAYQAWYLTNARSYSRGASGVTVGDRVEIELHEQAEGALPFARGIVRRGELVAIEVDDVSEEVANDPAEFINTRTFVVEVNGKKQRYRVGDAGAGSNGETMCRQLLLDFSEVGIRATDDLTVEMTLNNPTPYWPQLLGFYPLAPVNQTCIETHGSPNWTRPENVVTNGAYRLQFRRIRDRIRLVKNPDYWDAENVALEVIDALAINSLTTAFNMYETGQIDWSTKAPPLIARELLKADPPRNDFNPASQLGTYYYLINVTRKPYDDPRVRRALALAIDRDQIIETAGAGEQPARSLVPPGIAGYENALCPATNIEQAKQLLAKAGYPDGAGFPKLEILYNNDEQHKTIAELVRKQWQRGLGINVATRGEEWSSCLSSQRQLKYDVGRKAWIGDYVDPNTFLDMFVTDGENNNTGWGNAEYDEMIRNAKTEADPAKRLAMLHRAEELLMAQQPIIPIYYYVSRNLVRPRVRGFWNNLQDTHPLRALSIDDDASGPNEYMMSGHKRPPASTDNSEAQP